jgi:hypothetical protein|tara:strand:- start:72 stop:398 length:327 start_codon:yes stop_codon:yes gene_type:complete
LLRIKTVSKDVTDVKNEPANRIDPLTGYPYSIQSDITLPEFKKEKETEMERLGFAKGGKFNSNSNNKSAPLNRNEVAFKIKINAASFTEEEKEKAFNELLKNIDNFET